MTKCGKPIVSAQPGRVQVNKRQSAAGNYIVIDGKGKVKDLAYMHMKKKSKLKRRREGRMGERDRQGRRHRRRDRLPPALRDVVEPGLV